jgi:FtsH-binding integral membrane protein
MNTGEARNMDLESQEVIIEDLKDNPNMYSSTKVNFDNLTNFSGIDSEVQTHLQKVYATLGVTILFCGLGAYLYTLFHINLFIGFVCSIGLTIYLLASAGNKQAEIWRYFALFGFGLCQGLNAGVLVEDLLEIDPNLLYFGVGSTLAIFGCFTGAAMLAKRRSYLYLGSMLMSGLSMLVITSLVNIFLFRTEIGDLIWLYGGLALFCGFIIYDTQLIVEKVHAGNRDVTVHAFELFVDFINLLIRILIILRKMKGKK